MEIKITIQKDNLKTDFEINNADDATKILLIQNVFNLFDSKISMDEVLTLIDKTGKAYQRFFERMEQNEEHRNLNHNNEKVKLELINGCSEINNIEKELEPPKLSINPEEIKNAILNKEDKSDYDYVKTGIKIRNGIKHYKLRYECPVCSYKGNHVIPKDADSVYCHSCSKDMKVKFAHPKSTSESEPLQDSFGNFYRAGKFSDKRYWS